MRIVRRVMIIVSLCFVVLGITLMVGAAAMGGFRIENLFNDDRKRNTVSIKEKFDSVEVETALDSVIFIPAEDDAGIIELYENSRSYYDVMVEDNTLKIRYNENRKWFEYINLGSLSSHEVKVMVPAAQYKNITVKTGIGSITIPNDFTAENIVTETGIGNISAPKALKSTKINTGIGDITVPKGETSGNSRIKTGIGDIKVN